MLTGSALDSLSLADTPGLLTAAALAVISSWNYGFMLGSMNTASGAIRSSLGISADAGTDADFAWGLCVSIFCLGALFGCAAAAPLANTLGRRPALLATSIICTAGGACEALSSLFGCEAVPPASCVASAGVVLMLLGRILGGSPGVP